MDLGRFEISKGPSNRGGLDLGPFSKSNRPSGRGGLDLGLFEESNRPSVPEGGDCNSDCLRSPTDPQGGGWTLDLKNKGDSSYRGGVTK